MKDPNFLLLSLAWAEDLSSVLFSAASKLCVRAAEFRNRLSSVGDASGSTVAMTPFESLKVLVFSSCTFGLVGSC